MPSTIIRFYFDYESPNAYLAWTQLPKLAQRYGFNRRPRGSTSQTICRSSLGVPPSMSKNWLPSSRCADDLLSNPRFQRPALSRRR